jgi:uncharacterized protein YjbJ (UPF0337 family)
MFQKSKWGVRKYRQWLKARVKGKREKVKGKREKVKGKREKVKGKREKVKGKNKSYAEVCLLTLNMTYKA